MSEGETIITAENLSKVYRLYRKPHYRFLDMFGILRKSNAYSEHQALTNIDLEIKRGEKVAFIGRNGAGKSTLLKLITGVIRPSAGKLEVSQGAHALLQIGSGFHQDFTGRQNALAYLSHLGVSGRDANEKLAGIIDFSELEEYIDQPIKTYSTGMIARLMFSTSTAIAPDLLVLDEILGVGDAYFAHKSFERIREMCEGLGTTVLLVSHDIYSAAKLCERMVWIDKGQILFDGSTQEAIKAYETSIREQEEKRLRAKKFMSMTEGRHESKSYQGAEGGEPLIVEIQAPEPMEGPVFFERVALVLPGEWEVEIPVTDADAFKEEADAHLLKDSSNWADRLTNRNGHICREMRVFGTPFNKVAALVRVPLLPKEMENFLEIQCSYESSSGVPLKVSCINSKGSLIFNGELPDNKGEWKEGYAVGKLSCAPVPSKNIGTNRMRVLDARFVNEAGEEIYLIRHGEPAKLLIEYKINDLDLKENSQIVVAFHRDGSVDICRYISRALFFDGADQPTGIVEFSLPLFPLAAGRYTLTVMIAEQGYYDQDQTLYFTINPGVYSVRSKFLEFEVVGNTPLSAGTVFVGDGSWDVYGENKDSHDEYKLRTLPQTQRYLLLKAKKLADFKKIIFCPGWEMGFDENRGGRLLEERRSIFNSLAKFESIPPICFEWIEGLKLSLVLRGDIPRTLFIGGSYDPNELSILKAVIKPGMTVVDAGANLGIYSVYLAKLVGIEGRVLAFEPSSRELKNLERNINVNGLQNVVIQKIGLGSKSGVERLNVADDEFAGHNSFEPLQSLPIIRFAKGSHPPEWISGWNGEREFDCSESESVEFYIYSESKFDYQITGLSSPGVEVQMLAEKKNGAAPAEESDRPSAMQGSTSECGELKEFFPGWEIECSSTLRVDFQGGLTLHGNGGDYIRFFRRLPPEAHRLTIRLSGKGVPRNDVHVEEVSVETLDNIVADGNLGPIDFIKLDIEGYEAEALEGAKGVISRHRPILLIEAATYQRPQNAEKIQEFLLRHGYKIYEIDSASGKLKKSKRVPSSPNIFAVHNKKEVILEAVCTN